MAINSAEIIRSAPFVKWKRRKHDPSRFLRNQLSADQGLTLAISALTVAMIEPAFFRLLVAAVGGAMPDPACEFTAGVAAIDLSPLAMRTDEKDNTATRSLAKALPERGVIVIKHAQSRSGWTAVTEGGKMRRKRNLRFGNGASKV